MIRGRVLQGRAFDSSAQCPPPIPRSMISITCIHTHELQAFSTDTNADSPSTKWYLYNLTEWEGRRGK